MIPNATRAAAIERTLERAYRHSLWGKFVTALKAYRLIEPNDHIAVCISGGKDSMAMALLFKHLLRHTEIPFQAEFLVMDPGYSAPNLALLRQNLETLEIPARIFQTDIFAITEGVERSPCYLCARMRRGALYRIAKSLGCNKIALGHHYDDVIETTLMNLLNAGSFQTMLPKLHSDHYAGMEIIRPLYRVREKDLIAFAEGNGLSFLRCACPFTERCARQEDDSQRLKTKTLIASLAASYSPYIEKNLFKSAENVVLDKTLGYTQGGRRHSFLDDYAAEGRRQDERIHQEQREEAAIAKAESEHRAWQEDRTYYERFGGFLSAKNG